MKELDLTGAKLLKLWLRMGYYDYPITGEKDICTLVRMCLRSGLCGMGYLFMVVFLVAIGGLFLFFAGIMLSWLTLYLPEAYWADLDDMLVGFLLSALVSVVALIGFTVEVCQGKRNFAPEYMKRPLRKLFKNITTSTEETFVKEVTPSKTWIAIKEMYASVKDKTCIKVEL